MKTFKVHLPWVAWIIMVFIIMGIPGNYFPQIITLVDILSPDKIVHFFLFGVFVFLLLRSFMKQYTLVNRSYIVSGALFFGIFVGALTELLQHYVFVGRNGNIYDFLADAIGCLIGMSAYMISRRKKIVKS
ncbi:MAG: VanZ family protein [Bacteroidales bacterium]|nr:VanZ family protein [Bacteroidales bacterium]